jgi:hypothetical protein
MTEGRNVTQTKTAAPTGTMANQVTQTNRTSNLALAAHLRVEGYKLVAIEGPRRKRVFVFDRPIPSDLLLNFASSPAHRLIDAYRNITYELSQLPD